MVVECWSTRHERDIKTWTKLNLLLIERFHKICAILLTMLPNFFGLIIASLFCSRFTISFPSIFSTKNITQVLWDSCIYNFYEIFIVVDFIVMWNLKKKMFTYWSFQLSKRILFQFIRIYFFPNAIRLNFYVLQLKTEIYCFSAQNRIYHWKLHILYKISLKELLKLTHISTLIKSPCNFSFPHVLVVFLY